MNKLEYRNGLLYVSILLTHGSKTVRIENAIIDTGAAHTLILTDYLTELEVGLADSDQLVKSYGLGGVVFSAVRKSMDKIEMGDIILDNFKIDFGVIDPQERIDGLIGLDFMKASGLVLDLEELVYYKKAIELKKQ